MKDKFKAYLEEQFRKIRPTLSAMKYREEMLASLLERAQELKIKGIDDEELIYLTCIDELGDFQQELMDFEARVQEEPKSKRKIGIGVILGIVLMAVLAVTYLIVGFATGVWHPTWLIMVGGIFAGVAASLGILVIRLVRNKKYIHIRLIAVVIEIMLAVFVFLLLQLVLKISGSWMTFLAMVALIFGTDTMLAFLTNSKIKWFELPVFAEIFGVMLFVILGITTKIWHPMWVLCLAGIPFVIGELALFFAKRSAQKKAERGEKHRRLHKDENPDYWTKWSE